MSRLAALRSAWFPGAVASCHGKKRYTVWKHAWNDARTMRGKYRNDRKSYITPYPCRHCGGYHVGHEPQIRRERE